MTVYLVTRRKDHQITNNLIKVLEVQEAVDFLTGLIESGKIGREEDTKYHPGQLVLGYDQENRTETEPTREGLLLSAFCLDDTRDNEVVLTIDNTSVDSQEVFTPDILKRCVFISHNADHEAKYDYATGFIPSRYGCTMVNSKRLMSGMEGLRFDLISEINRRLGYDAISKFMDKDIRNEFANCTYFRDDHILYNASDTIRLKDIYYEQRRLGDQLGMSFLLNSLNSRIIPEIASTEVRGIKHNSEKWINIARERKEKADKICQELNDLITNQYKVNLELVNPALKKERESLQRRELRLQERKQKLENQLKLLEEKGKTHLKSYQTQKTHLEKLGSEKLLIVGDQQLDKPLIQVQSNVINWGSTKQVLEVFRQVGMKLPESKDKKTKKLKPSVDKEARAQWFVQQEGSEYEPLMKSFDSFKKIEHNIKSFGEKWVEQYVRNGRIYPRFDQAGTETGRWSAGDKGNKANKKHPNTSQIPAREGPEYRNCFQADEDRELVTADWKNQEGVLIISLSGDMEMIKITSEKDQHGTLGTRCYRAIYKHRYERTGDPKWLELSQTYVMDKSTLEGEKARNKFKNSMGLFPILYGSEAHKVSVTAGLNKEEAQIGIDVIKSHAPTAAKFLEANRQHGSTYGYVIHNTRSGSRRWFQPMLDHIHYGYPMSKSKKVEVELAAGNSCIQGSGSDLLKEAMAMIACWNNIYKQDIRFVLSNYDEVVYSIPKGREDYVKVIEQFMIRAAKNYLIPEVDMECDIKVAEVWEK
jgi:DNA polymerase I-like protein with 3'-5' exonuclease and polymerase domains